MKILSVFVLGLAGLVPTYADTLNFPNGPIVIPNGSTITSESVNPVTGGEIVTFSFGDGTGAADGDSNDGGSGSITFTTPVTKVSLNFIDQALDAGVSASNGQGFECDIETTPCTGDIELTFSGTGITSITWGYFKTEGGIDSMSYVEAPEPSTLLLLTVPLLLGPTRWARRSLRKQFN
jgi:hypothetical protein